MTSRLTFIFALVALTGLSSPGADYVKLQPQATSTEHIDFTPGGVIRVNGLYGNMFVEGSDESQVEISATKYLSYGYKSSQPARRQQEMDAIRVAADRTSPSELAISIKSPERFGWLWHPTIPIDIAHVTLEYHLRVPRNSRLVIHHGPGDLLLRDVTGDIEATVSRGDIMVWVSGKGNYSIDARTRNGTVLSELSGSKVAYFLLGQAFTSHSSAASQKLFLRAAFGGIAIEPILPESEARPLPAGAK